LLNKLREKCADYSDKLNEQRKTYKNQVAVKTR